MDISRRRASHRRYRQTCCVVDETGIPFDHVLVNGTFERIYALSKPAASGAANGSVPPPSQNASGLRCYPRLVIFGAQKAGSTALAALLAESGPVKFARRKELHYFDQASIWCRGTLPHARRADMSPTNRGAVAAAARIFRGDASAAATRIFRGNESRRRRG